MIRVIDGCKNKLHADVLDEMHRIRARVFHDRLGWDVIVENGRERDRFDDCNPLYLVSIDNDTGAVDGSLRLLPTTGPNMLRDVFQVLLPEDEIVESPVVWESSRFSINPDMKGDVSTKRLNKITVELLCGIVDVGIASGIDHVVSVYDARMARIFRTANCLAEVIGTPTRIGTVMTYAGLFEISPAMRERIALAGGIHGEVLERSRLPIAA